jgi:lysophospholipase L1-like esterase
VVLLGLCEAGLRARAWMKYGSAATGLRDPMLTYLPQADLYAPTPGYEVKGGRIHIKINSLGFRGDDFTAEKPANTFRIAALGASTTFSAEVSSNHAVWTHRLQEKLQAAYPSKRIEVVNAAVGGYVAADNLKNLKHRVLPLDPDLVIYYEANNEIVKDTRDVAVREGIVAADELRQPAWVTTLSKVSLMFDLAYKNLAILVRSREGGRRVDRVPPDLPAHFTGQLDQMRAMLAERHIPLVLSTFIVKYRRDQSRATQIANADVAFYYMPWMSIDGLLDAMDVYNDAVVKYGNRVGLLVVDDRFAIPPDTEHFSDCMHLLDKGNEAMAERFARALIKAGVVAGRPSPVTRPQ